MKRIVPLLLAAFASIVAQAAGEVVKLSWDERAVLPPSPGRTEQPGVAGPFAGVHRDALIVAGGANFPDKLPWDGGAKVWWDDVWVLENLTGGEPRWVAGANAVKTFKLPRPLGYGISVSTADGVICAGGHDAERCYADVFMLSWDAHARVLRRTTLPSMPEPLSFMAGALVGNTLYVAGGQTTMKDAVPSTVFWSLDLSKRERRPEFKWSVLPAWPGPPRVLAVAAAQRGARGDEFFLFSGRRPQAGGATDILSDAYAFDPETRTWRTLSPVGDGAKRLGAMAASAAAFGDREVILFGGDRGEHFRELEAHDLAIAAARAKLATATAVERAALEREVTQRLDAKRLLYDAHPGFARDVLVYDTRTDAWRTVGRSPFPPQVTTVAVPTGRSFILPSGEIKPGIRTPAIIRVTPETKPPMNADGR